MRLAKPLMASSSVVLPAPFGPMSPTMVPSATSKLTSSTATTPPYAHADVVERQERGIGSRRRLGCRRRASESASARPWRSRRVRTLLEHDVDRPDDALGVEHDGEHEADAGDRPVPVAQVEPLGGRVVDDAAGGEHPGEDAAGDGRDAGEVGGGEHADADEDVERVEGDVALLVAEHRAAEAGDERGDGEREDLHAHDVDAGAGGGPLVGAHGEHRGAEPARRSCATDTATITSTPSTSRQNDSRG